MQIADYERDGDGFLADPGNWTAEFAQLAAEEEGLEYTADFQEVVIWARTFFAESGSAPTIRDFGKGFYADKFGKSDRKGPPQYLAGLTGGSGMKVVDKIAGLPKPTGCV